MQKVNSTNNLSIFKFALITMNYEMEKCKMEMFVRNNPRPGFDLRFPSIQNLQIDSNQSNTLSSNERMTPARDEIVYAE
jgi:hypothetical protein